MHNGFECTLKTIALYQQHYSKFEAQLFLATIYKIIHSLKISAIIKKSAPTVNQVGLPGLSLERLLYHAQLVFKICLLSCTGWAGVISQSSSPDVCVASSPHCGLLCSQFLGVNGAKSAPAPCKVRVSMAECSRSASGEVSMQRNAQSQFPLHPV